MNSVTRCGHTAVSIIYRISLNKVRGHQLNQQFQKCKILNNVPFLCTTLFQKRGHYSRGDIIQGRTIFKVIQYLYCNCVMGYFLQGYCKTCYLARCSLAGKQRSTISYIWEKITYELETLAQLALLHTVFPHIVSSETILF